MLGYKNNEMAARWVQFGVFSPINRLHSSKSEFMGKEPWRYPMEIGAVMTDFLRLRHSLIPYLYTMNHRAYAENIPADSADVLQLSAEQGSLRREEPVRVWYGLCGSADHHTEAFRRQQRQGPGMASGGTVH